MLYVLTRTARRAALVFILASMFVGGRAGMGPAWTRGEMERPAGEKSMGTWTAAVYTEEQQERLNVDEMGEPLPAQEPVLCPPVDEIREVMYSYVSSATYMGARHQPCRFRTSLCPDRCGHATDVFSFKLDALAVTKNEESGSARWVTPEKEGTEHMIGESDLKEFVGLAKSLAAGDTVDLRWSHDYVTVGGSSGPDRPVTHLARAAAAAAEPAAGGGGGLWEGAEALGQQREMAAQWQRERAQELHQQTELATQQLEEDSAELERTLSQIEALRKPGPPVGGGAMAAPEVTERREATAAAGRDRRAALLAARRAEGGDT